MIRCMHLVKSAQPECTGICRIVRSLAKCAKQHGYDISVVFLADGPLRAQMSAAGINAHVVSWKGTFTDVPGAVRAGLWVRGNGPEIVHLHFGGRAVRAICKLGGADVVVQHIHGRSNELTGEIRKSLSLPWADAVIACSNAVAASVISHRPEVIYAGIKVEPVPGSLAEYSGPLRLGVLSRLTPIKNVAAVIHAAVRLRDLGITIQVNIAGSGSSENSLRSIARELNVADRVCFLGWLEDTRELLSRWDLFVMPSLDEGFPLSALEAMAAALPVLASRVGGLPEIVVDGVTGYLIPPGDIEGLVRHIAELANDRVRLAKMGAAGRRRVQEEFTEEAMASHMASFYARLLQQKQLRPNRT